MRLLVTRPEPDATRTAEALRARGHEVVVAPLMRVEPIAGDIGGPFAAVLITSANAARAIAAHPRGTELMRLPLLAVGARSAEAARAAGCANVTSADGALGDLVGLAARRFPGGRLLYLAGEDRAGDLAGELSARGIAVETAVIYRAVALDMLPLAIARELHHIAGVLHYSYRSAMTLLRLAEGGGVLDPVLGLTHYCLSDDVTAPLRQAGAKQILAAAASTESALFALLPA